MTKRVTMKQYERSKADAKEDRTQARKRGQTVKQYEGSPADRKADASAVRELNRRLASKDR
jgi:hypothetical protein